MFRLQEIGETNEFGEEADFVTEYRYVSYHTHSLWSDGECSISRMVAAAEAAGAEEYGVSDHYVIHPTVAYVNWSMPLSSLPDYLDEGCEVRERVRIPLRLGLEIDFFPETTRQLEEQLAPHVFRLDYLVGSVHFVNTFPVDADASYWESLTEEEINAIHETYWIRVRQLAEWGGVDFVGHLDLPKKFAFYPSVDLQARIAEALDAIAAADMAVEINTAGWDKPCAEGYPAEAILRACRERDIPVLVNDDAHHPRHFGRHYHRAFELLRSVGYTEVVRFNRRERIRCPL